MMRFKNIYTGVIFDVQNENLIPDYEKNCSMVKVEGNSSPLEPKAIEKEKPKEKARGGKTNGKNVNRSARKS